MLTWEGEPANMILDDGGDATMMVLRGAQYEKAGVVPPAEDDDPTEWKVFLGVLRERFETDKTNLQIARGAQKIHDILGQSAQDVEKSLGDISPGDAAPAHAGHRRRIPVVLHLQPG